jgi:hypothetical protein
MVQTTKHSEKKEGDLSHSEALEQAALYMIQTLPRMFKTIKHRARVVEAGQKELGDSQMWALRVLAEDSYRGWSRKQRVGQADS